MGTMHPLVKAQNDGVSANSRKERKVRRSERIRKFPQRFNPKFGAATEWKSNAVANIVYMIQNRDYDSNVDTDNILSLQAEWNAERESYAIKTQSHDPYPFLNETSDRKSVV